MYTKLFISVIFTIFLILLVYKRKRLIIPITVAYLAIVIYLVAFSSGRIDMGGISIKFPFPFFRAILSHQYGPTTNRSFLNIILFIPFGYLLPAIISLPIVQKSKPDSKPRWLMIVFAGFAFSLLIETSQFIFRFGVFELDDLVKNTIGTVIGYMIWRGLERNQ